MREIKFRAWDKKNKKFIYDYKQAIPVHYEGEKYDIKIGGGRNHMGIYVLNENKDDCELLLYTGIKDMNGKEIYEGDIIKIGNMIYKIEWIDYGFFTVSNEFITELDGARIRIASEVIGNIYENSELIKNEER